jgi:aminopeptidase N
MPVRSRVGGSDDAVQVYTFEDSPPMSPYLLAVAAGDLVQYNGTGGAAPELGGDGIPQLRLWAAPGQEGQLAAAAAAAPAAFRFYTDYFGVALPPELAKMDLVAVPGRTGAMEVRAEPGALC